MREYSLLLFRFYAVSLIFQIVASSGLPPATRGSVRGRVIDASGHPQAGFSVRVFGSSPDSTQRAEALTDQDGSFLISNLSSGDYAIYPYNNTWEYPLRADMFLSNTPDRFHISDTGENVRKDLVLPPAASLVRGHVIDKDGKSVSAASVVLCHTDEVTRSAEIRTDKHGDFIYVVPSEENLSILVKYPNQIVLQQSNIKLLPSENKNIVMAMPPVSAVSGKRCVPFMGFH